MSELWLLRHAPTQANLGNVFMGSRDVPADPDALGAASSLRDHAGLAEAAKATPVYCSPLRRARATAQAVFPTSRIVVDERLAERRLGAWEGMPKKEVRERWPEAFLPGGAFDLWFTPPGGEPITDLFGRVHGFLSEVSAAGGGGRPIVVTHNGVIRVMRFAVGECEREQTSLMMERFLEPSLLKCDPATLRHPGSVAAATTT